MQSREHNLNRHISYAGKPSPVDISQPMRPASSENQIVFPCHSANVTKYTAKGAKPLRNHKSEQCNYERYDHEEVPVQEGSGKLNNINLTESKLNAIETEALKNISKSKLPESGDAVEPNTEVVKAALLEILNNFFVNVDDFEDHKRRFHELLKKDPHASNASMEELIKEVIKRILSQSSLSNNSYKSLETSSSSETKREDHVAISTAPEDGRQYKNQNRDGPNDFTPLSSLNSIDSLDYFKHLIGSYDLENYAKSEIKLSCERTKRLIASADDINKFLADKLEFEGFLLHQNKSVINDSEIPVKSVCPMTNFTMHRDASNRIVDRESRKSFMSKVCGFFCKKLTLVFHRLNV